MQVKSWFSRPVLAVLFLSFSSTLPLILIGSTLQAWYTVAGAKLFTIGMLTLIGYPYLFKFLWAPIMDRFAFFGLDRRRGWIFITQFSLAVGLGVIALLTPETHPRLLALVALIVAFLSASQDVCIDAYRVDVLNPSNRGFGAAVTNFGGRGAMLVGGAFALVMATEMGWRSTYFIMAGIMLVMMLITWWSPRTPEVKNAPASLRAAVVEPLRNFLRRDYVVAIIVFILIYKLCDALAFSLNLTFLYRGIGFSLTEIALFYKVISLTALLFGSFIGGVYLQRLGMYKALLYFGILQTTANLSYMVLAMVGKSYVLMAMAVFTEYFCSGLSSVAFLVFLMSLCDKRYSASQYAIFSALMAVGRVLVGPEVAIMVEHLGWALFFFVTFLTGIPALFLLMWLREKIEFEYQPVTA